MFVDIGVRGAGVFFAIFFAVVILGIWLMPMRVFCSLFCAILSGGGLVLLIMGHWKGLVLIPVGVAVCVIGFRSKAAAENEEAKAVDEAARRARLRGMPFLDDDLPD